MATFLVDLAQSIFTPGPTPTLVVATNASFAALQVVLLALLIATYSVHFLILSFLSGGLWWAINWFVREIQAANEKEDRAQKLRDMKKERDIRQSDDSGTETEEVAKSGNPLPRQLPRQEGLGDSLMPGTSDDSLKKRRSLGEVSGTDSEWDKVDSEDMEN